MNRMRSIEVGCIVLQRTIQVSIEMALVVHIDLREVPDDSFTVVEPMVWGSLSSTR
jgi:hypothetical protein